MRSKTVLTLMFLFIIMASKAQNIGDIIIPHFGDKYSEFVQQLELGKKDIDFKEGPITP